MSEQILKRCFRSNEKQEMCPKQMKKGVFDQMKSKRCVRKKKRKQQFPLKIYRCASLLVIDV